MLKGKTAIVTGGSQGIGRAISLLLAKNGANVAILFVGDETPAINTKKEIEEMGGKAIYMTCNVADFNATKEAVDKVVAEFGTVDILVNNAGITKDNLMLKMSEADYDAVLNVNLKGTFNMMKQVYPIMMRKRSGKIVSISSVVGLCGNPGQANYSASKAGIIGLTKTMAKELASRHVNVNAIAPGFIQTDMTKAISDKAKEAATAMIPMGSYGTVDDIAQTALFLVSPASDYITGEVIRVDGGMAM
ncbi:MAG: 3-oxoacyl-[acyl-carrier-protein] reductase [Clostridia bacterium]|nr:3-oxoacyl-[acyl-carrier-protein] reductase [Clostridia bacterium]